MEVYGKIAKPFWDDRPVAVVGGGPSLVDFDFERLRGAHVLAVKGAITNMPWADACFGMGDYSGWRGKLEDVQSRVYWLLDQPELPATANVTFLKTKNVTFLKRLAGQGMSNDPSAIYGGGTSGFGAMQVCLHKRAKRIVLFGFDYDGEVSKANNARRREQDAANWRAWAEHFSVYVTHLSEHRVSVMNACPQSAIGCFQKCTLDDGVALLHKPLR